MKKYILSMSLVVLTSSAAFAGGVFCKEYPAETDAAACCSWAETHIPGCMPGC